jgi:hypothetical protein
MGKLFLTNSLILRVPFVPTSTLLFIEYQIVPLPTHYYQRHFINERAPNNALIFDPTAIVLANSTFQKQQIIIIFKNLFST